MNAFYHFAFICRHRHFAREPKKRNPEKSHSCPESGSGDLAAAWKIVTRALLQYGCTKAADTKKAAAPDHIL